MATTTAKRANPQKAVGTSLKGIVRTTYKHLVEVFGVPSLNRNKDSTIRAQWVLEYSNGVVCTIYDWKEYGAAIAEVIEWHIGSSSYEAYDLVLEELEVGRKV